MRYVFTGCDKVKDEGERKISVDIKHDSVTFNTDCGPLVKVSNSSPSFMLQDEKLYIWSHGWELVAKFVEGKSHTMEKCS
jgi:hypothetical protein